MGSIIFGGSGFIGQHLVNQQGSKRIPAILLKTKASLLYSCGKLFGMEFIGIHPDRVKKLMVSTNVLGKKLNDKLKLNYSLNEALEDWYSDCDNDDLY